MKKVALIIFSLVFFVNVAYALSYQPPDNFRGIKWGTHVEALSDMVVVDPGDSVGMFKRQNDPLHLGKAEVQSVFYAFYRGQFYAAYVTFKNPANFAEIKNALVQNYGNPAQTDPVNAKHVWGDHEKVSITLDYRERQQQGSLIYLYKPLSDQEEKDNSNQ